MTKLIYATTSLALAGTLMLANAARAADPIQIAGRDTCKTTEQHAIPVEGDPDHVLIVEKGTCSVSATGQSSRFDGGQYSWVDTVDLVKGNGPVHGYLQEKYKDGSTEADSYAGQITTTMIEGKPKTTGQGTWEMTHGTGSLANVQQRGTWKVTPTSETEFVSDWRGTLTEDSKQ
jgi:hypothetical protein